jgi:hypothetical protein
MTMLTVRLCRKIGSPAKNTTVHLHSRFAVVPRAGDHVRLDVYGKIIEVERVELTPLGTSPDIYLKPDYRGYSSKGNKVKTHDEIVKEYIDKGWFPCK